MKPILFDFFLAYDVIQLMPASRNLFFKLKDAINSFFELHGQLFVFISQKLDVISRVRGLSQSTLRISHCLHLSMPRLLDDQILFSNVRLQ